MSSFQWKSCGCMVELVQFVPCICRMTDLAACNGSIGEPCGHSIGKLTTMGIFVAYGAGPIFKKELYRF